MDLVNAFERATMHTAQIMKGVSPDQYAAPTPCAEWDVRTLCNHLIGGAWMFAGALAGKPLPSGDPGDLAGDDPGSAYAAAVDSLTASLQLPGVADGMNELAIGTVPASVTLTLGTLDTIVHGWDLATATGQDATIADDLATIGDALARGAVSDEWRGPRAPFAYAIEVGADATPTERLVAFTGRPAYEHR